MGYINYYPVPIRLDFTGPGANSMRNHHAAFFDGGKIRCGRKAPTHFFLII
jgi:hypothetical protein